MSRVKKCFMFHKWVRQKSINNQDFRECSQCSQIQKRVYGYSTCEFGNSQSYSWIDREKYPENELDKIKNKNIPTIFIMSLDGKVNLSYLPELVQERVKEYAGGPEGDMIIKSRENEKLKTFGVSV